MYLASSSLAMALRWTSSGPSARRRVRWWAYMLATGKSPETPPPPWAWIAQSVIWQAMLGAITLIMAISALAILLPTDRKSVVEGTGVDTGAGWVMAHTKH